MQTTECEPFSDFWRRELQRFLPDASKALDTALGYVCCPVCYVMADIPFDYLASLPKRWTEEQELRELVCRSRGFCNRHTWRMNGMQSLVAIARVFVDVLDALAEAPDKTETCPICHLQQLVEQTVVHCLAERLRSPAMQERYEDLLGVCYRHYDCLLRCDLTDDARAVLVRAQETQRRELAQNLHSFLEKNTIEGKWTRTAAENHAPRHTLLKLAGNEEA